MSVPIYTVLIRRDAHTTTPVTVPAYEVPIIQTIFGEENVQNSIGQPIADDVVLTEKDRAGEFEPKDEHERLSAKYSGNEAGLFVEQVYGKKSTGALAKAIAKATIKTNKGQEVT